MTWQNGTNLALGLAILLIAFLGLTGPALAWTLGFFGAVIAAVSWSEMAAKPKEA